MTDAPKDLRFFKVVLNSVADGVFTVDGNRIVTGSDSGITVIDRDESLRINLIEHIIIIINRLRLAISSICGIERFPLPIGCIIPAVRHIGKIRFAACIPEK